MDVVGNPAYFTGDLPPNSIVGLNCENRPDQAPFINAINEAKRNRDDDQIVIPCKCPAAFEWKLNHGCAEKDFNSVHIEESKDPQLSQGPLAQRLQGLRTALEGNWSTKRRGIVVNECLDTNVHELSDKENMLFRWMCIHVSLDGTPTSNPKSENVFEYIHYATTSVGTDDWNVHVRKEATMAFSYQPFRHWTTTRTKHTENDRRNDRDNVGQALRATEASLFPHMAMLTRRWVLT